MANRIIVYRFQTNPRLNATAAAALLPFYRAYPSKAIMGPTPFGMVSNFLTDASAEEVFNSLLDANIGNHFMVIEIDENDMPIITLSSTGIHETAPSQSMPSRSMNVTESDTEVKVKINHATIDRNKTTEQLNAELDALLSKVHSGGVISLTPIEKSRLDHLSQL